MQTSDLIKKCLVNTEVLKQGINDVETKLPELVNNYWDFEKNILKPNEVFYNDRNIKIWILRKECGHSYLQTPFSYRLYGKNCSICAKNMSYINSLASHRAVKEGINDLQSQRPELLRDWDYDKNDILPNQIKKADNKIKVWWKCQKCGYSYQKTVSYKSREKACRCCSGQIVIKGVNDFESLFPELAKEWDYSLNSILPSEVTKASSYRVHWVCKDCGCKWITSVANRTTPKCKTNCPQCNTGLTHSGFISITEKLVSEVLTKLNIEFICEYRFSFNNHIQRIDFFIPCQSTSVNITRDLAIEVDGRQHYSNNSKQIILDNNKNLYCSVNNILLLRIPGLDLIKDYYKSNQSIVIIEKIICTFLTNYTIPEYIKEFYAEVNNTNYLETIKSI